VAACASTRPAASPEVARGEVLDAEHRWWRAVSRGDVDHALTKFSSDTIFETPDGAQLRGRVALGERLRRDGRDRIEVLGTPEHVHVDSPELVVVTGTGQWTGVASDPGAPTTIRYIDTWRWTGSSWRLVSAATGPVSESSAGTALVQQVLAAWSTGDWAGLQPLLAPGYRAKSAGGGEGSELRRRFESFHRNWARARFDIEEQFAVGERIVTRIAATLTEAGTGRILRYAGLDVSRVVDGQLTDHWTAGRSSADRRLLQRRRTRAPRATSRPAPALRPLRPSPLSPLRCPARTPRWSDGVEGGKPAQPATDLTASAGGTPARTAEFTSRVTAATSCMAPGSSPPGASRRSSAPAHWAAARMGSGGAFVARAIRSSAGMVARAVSLPVRAGSTRTRCAASPAPRRSRIEGAS
jgi:ketosteroid isomerase-like protein